MTKNVEKLAQELSVKAEIIKVWNVAGLFWLVGVVCAAKILQLEIEQPGRLL